MASDSVLVSDIITLAKQRCDMENTNFVSAAEWLTYADQSYRKFYNLITTLYEDYNVSSTDYTTVADTEEYDLPTGFLKVRLVELYGVTPRPLTLRAWTLSEKNRLSYTVLGYPVRFATYGNKLRLMPAPRGPYQVRLWYIPTATAITATSQSVEVYNGFDEYIALDMAIRALMKEESNTDRLERERDRMERMLEETMRGRDAGQPRMMTDIERQNEGALYPFFMGTIP
jgi:hypothetical protein